MNDLGGGGVRNKRQANHKKSGMTLSPLKQNIPLALV